MLSFSILLDDTFRSLLFRSAQIIVRATIGTIDRHRQKQDIYRQYDRHKLHGTKIADFNGMGNIYLT
jgi:hypothetical protein